MSGSTVAIIGQNDELRRAVRSLVGRCDFHAVEAAASFEAAQKLIRGGAGLVVVTVEPCFGSAAAQAGLSVALELRAREPAVPVLFIAANSSEEFAIAAIRAGVSDYLRHPIRPEELAATVRRLLPEHPVETVLPDLVEPAGGRLVGRSRVMQEVRNYVRRAAATGCTVLITGETGTGKELVAQLIHRNSPRRDKALVCLNCAAIPDSLLESELFGYERGAFTGALSAQPGKLALASGGTVFFDEIGDMSPYSQAKILRTLESGEIYPLGGRSSVPVDVRVVAATNLDLEQLTASGRFRKDLFFRLNVARIPLPALRDRREDIPLILAYYIGHFNVRFETAVEGIADDALKVLAYYDWPGNVRELRNTVEAIYVNRPRRMISAADLPVHIRAQPAAKGPPPSERDQLLTALMATNWNKSKAAEKLRWSRMRVYRNIAKYGLLEAGKMSAQMANP